MANAIAEALGVFITDELARRPDRQPNPAREKEAFRSHLASLAEGPDQVLPQFVSIAMELLRGSSAGISLFEPKPSPGVFRWRHLRGELSKFEHATTPRHHSPCGVTLDRNAPVLAAHPERVYEWIADAGMIVPEVLLVPLHVGADTPFGTLWVVADRAGHFCSDDARLARELADFISTALRIVETEEHLTEALHQQELLTREMSHRVKNAFALAQSLVSLSVRSATTAEELAEVLSGRLSAVAAAHDLIRRDDGTTGSTSLRSLVSAVVRPYEDGQCSRTSIADPQITCGRAAANALALVLHELATNAVKYGALSTETGHLTIGWEIADQSLILIWEEIGGPVVERPVQTSGFGTTLIERTIGGQLGGRFERSWLVGGVTCTITIALSKLAS